jgi:hypothetical protein
METQNSGFFFFEKGRLSTSRTKLLFITAEEPSGKVLCVCDSESGK